MPLAEERLWFARVTEDPHRCGFHRRLHKRWGRDAGHLLGCLLGAGAGRLAIEGLIASQKLFDRPPNLASVAHWRVRMDQQDRTSDEIRPLTAEEMDAVSGGMAFGVMGLAAAAAAGKSSLGPVRA